MQPPRGILKTPQRATDTYPRVEPSVEGQGPFASLKPTHSPVPPRGYQSHSTALPNQYVRPNAVNTHYTIPVPYRIQSPPKLSPAATKATPQVLVFLGGQYQPVNLFPNATKLTLFGPKASTPSTAVLRPLATPLDVTPGDPQVCAPPVEDVFQSLPLLPPRAPVAREHLEERILSGSSYNSIQSSCHSVGANGLWADSDTEIGASDPRPASSIMVDAPLGAANGCLDQNERDVPAESFSVLAIEPFSQPLDSVTPSGEQSLMNAAPRTPINPASNLQLAALSSPSRVALDTSDHSLNHTSRVEQEISVMLSKKFSTPNLNRAASVKSLTSSVHSRASGHSRSKSMAHIEVGNLLQETLGTRVGETHPGTVSQRATATSDDNPDNGAAHPSRAEALMNLLLLQIEREIQLILTPTDGEIVYSTPLVERQTPRRRDPQVRDFTPTQPLHKSHTGRSSLHSPSRGAQELTGPVQWNHGHPPPLRVKLPLRFQSEVNQAATTYPQRGVDVAYERGAFGEVETHPPVRASAVPTRGGLSVPFRSLSVTSSANSRSSMASRSTIPSSVDEQVVLMDLTHDEVDLTTVLNKRSNSIMSYTSAYETTKEGRVVEVVLVDDDTGGVPLAHLGALHHHSATAMASFDDLNSVYSNYAKFPLHEPSVGLLRGSISSRPSSSLRHVVGGVAVHGAVEKEANTFKEKTFAGVATSVKLWHQSPQLVSATTALSGRDQGALTESGYGYGPYDFQSFMGR